MATRTTVLTKFWEDPYIQTLPPTDKLLFKYLIDGPQIEPTLGIYEVSLNTMAFHTGLDKENIEHSLNRFAEAGKMHNVDSWIVVKNHFKNNPIKGSQSLVNSAHKRFLAVPWFIRDRIIDPTDTLYVPYLDPTHTLYVGDADPTFTIGAPHASLPIPSHPKDGKGKAGASRALGGRSPRQQAQGTKTKVETLDERELREARELARNGE